MVSESVSTSQTASVFWKVFWTNHKHLSQRRRTDGFHFLRAQKALVQVWEETAHLRNDSRHLITNLWRSVIFLLPAGTAACSDFSLYQRERTRTVMKVAPCQCFFPRNSIKWTFIESKLASEWITKRKRYLLVSGHIHTIEWEKRNH